MQAVAEVQETPSSALVFAPLGLGAVWTVQVVPFHASVNVKLELAATAVQALDEVQDTPSSMSSPDG